MAQRSPSYRRLWSIWRRCGLTPRIPAPGKRSFKTPRRYQVWLGLEALEQRLQLSGVPTLTTMTTLVGATEHTAYAISYANLLAASNAVDFNGEAISFRIESVAATSGTLTENGAAVVAKKTLVSTGDSLTWTPSASGQVDAFTVEAFDGTKTSTKPVEVKIAVAPGEVGYDEAYYLANNPTVKAEVIAGTFSSGEQQFDEYGRAEGLVPSEEAIGFNEQWYLDQYPAVAAAVKAGTYYSGLEQYLEVGKSEGNLPGPLAVGFNESFYLANNPDVAAAVKNGVYLSGYEHYVLYGYAEGRLPGPLAVGFNESFYLANNPDVAAAVKAGVYVSGFEHYVLYGEAEGRLPGPLAVGFNESFYLANNPDVAAAVKAGVYVSGFEHYVLYGEAEGRLPGPLAVGFNESFYLANNPDVAAAVKAGVYVSGFEHYVLYGEAEGRLPGPLAVGFNESFYLANNPDVAAAVKAGVYVSGFEHYVLYGEAEGRLPGPLAVGFNEAFYLANNPDVAAAVKAGVYVSGFEHYVLYGEAEGRLPGPLAVGFSESYYLANNPDVAAAVNNGLFISGFEHYVLYGEAEGRLPGPLAVGFDESYYLSEYPDVAAAVNAGVYVSGYEHYVLYGYAEGRFPHPQTPLVTGSTSAASVTSPNPSTTSAAQLIPDLTITDTDTSNLSSATVAITNAQTGDYLALGGGYTINGSNHVLTSGSVDTGVILSGDDTTTLTFSDTASISTYQAILDSVRFFSTSGDSVDTRDISVAVTSSWGTSSTADTFNVTYPPTLPSVTGSTISAVVNYPNDATIAAQLAPDLTLTDPNPVDLTGATVTLNGDSVDVMSLEELYTVNGSNEVLDNDVDTGVTLTGNGTDSMTLSGTATPAVYQGIINAIRFYTTSGDTTTVRHVTVTITNADSKTSAGDEFSVVFPVQTPALTGTTSAASVTSPDSATTLAAQFQPDLSILDRDSANMIEASVAYDAPVSGDTLSIVGYTLNGYNVLINGMSQSTGITLTGNNTDSLTFSGAASQATYEAVLNSIVFYTTSQDTADARQIDATVTDVNSMTSPTDSFDITFAPVAPTVTGSTTPATVVSPDPSTTTPAQLLPDLTIADPSITSLAGAAVAIVTNAQSGDTMTLGNGYTIVSGEVYDSGSNDTGISISGNNTDSLSFSGTASVSAYQGVLNSIVFYTTSGDITDVRGVSVTVTDANSLTSTADTFNVTFPAAPTVTGTATFVTVPSPDPSTTTPAQVLPDLTITDSAASILTGATVSITNAQTGDYMTLGNGYTILSGEVYDSGSNDTGISISGNNTITLIFSSASGASPATYEGVLNSIVFYTTSGDVTDIRDVSVTVSDANALTSTADTFDVSFPAAPTVTGSTTATTVASPNPGTVIAAQVSPDLSATDSSAVTSGQITITNAQTGDTLAIGNGFTVNGSNEVYDNYGNPTSLTVSSSNNGATLTFSGQAAASVYAEVFNSIVFYTTSGDVTDTRQISVTISDDFGLTSAADTFNVTFPAAPTVTGSTTSASPTLDSGNGALYVAQLLPDVTLSSSTNILGATVSMTTSVSGDYILLEGGYTVNDSNLIVGTNITITGNGSSTTVTLSGNDTQANYQAVINALTFQTTANDDTTARSVSVTIQNIAGQNSAADVFTLTTVSVSQSFNEYEDFTWPDEVPYCEAPTVGITYSGTNLTGAAVSALNSEFEGGHLPGTQMYFDTSLYTVSGGEVYDSSGDDTGVAVTGYGTDTMSFSGTASATVYADILSAIRFFNTSFSNPWYDNLTFTVTVTDPAGLTSTPESTTIYNYYGP